MSCGVYGKFTKEKAYDRLPGDDRITLDTHLRKCERCREQHKLRRVLSQATQQMFAPSPQERLASIRNWKLLPWKELNEVYLQEGLKPSIPLIGTDPIWYAGFLDVGKHSLSVTYALHCDPNKEELAIVWGPRIYIYRHTISHPGNSRKISVLQLPAEEQARIERLDQKVRQLFKH